MIPELSTSDKALQLRDWLKLVDFGTKALQFNSDIGKVLDEQPITRQPGGREDLKGAKRLSDVYDFRFYSMGSVYTHCSIPFDVMGEYRAMMAANKTPYEGPRIVLNFNNPVFEGLNEWDTILEGIWTGQPMDDLVRFMTSQRIRQQGTSTYWGIKYKEVAIPDPMCIDRKEYDVLDPLKRVVIGVFYPVGNQYSLGIAPIGGYPPVCFNRYSPDPLLVKEGSIMLNPTPK